jgi:UDP-glucose 4-epimerase
VAKFLVTGGAGFIGSNLTQSLLKGNHEVVVIDNLSKGKQSNVPKKVKFYDFDLAKFPKYLIDDRQSFDCVFHLAGQSSGERSVLNPIKDLQSNLQSTHTIIRLVKELNVPKLIFASSMAVYGDQNKLPATETMHPNPLTPYGIHKLASEQLLKIAAKDLSISISVLRLFNVYGPGQDLLDKRQGMLSIYLSYLLENKPILVRGSLDRVRDFVYIDDVIDAMQKVSQEKCPGFEVLNICTGVGTKIIDLIEKLCKHTKNINHEVNSSTTTPGDQFKIYGSPSKIQQKYGWKHNFDLDKGIRKTLEKLA